MKNAKALILLLACGFVLAGCDSSSTDSSSNSDSSSSSTEVGTAEQAMATYKAKFDSNWTFDSWDDTYGWYAEHSNGTTYVQFKNAYDATNGNFMFVYVGDSNISSTGVASYDDCDYGEVTSWPSSTLTSILVSVPAVDDTEKFYYEGPYYEDEYGYCIDIYCYYAS